MKTFNRVKIAAAGLIETFIWTAQWSTCHYWQWSTGDIGNGWAAVVSDHSQTCAPPQPTRYTANAICRYWIVTAPDMYDSFADAKRAALRLAAAQKEASADPECIVRPWETAGWQ
jgi:hypothetical protein